MNSAILTLTDEQVAAIADRVTAALPEPAPLAVNVERACQMLSVSWDYWAEHIAPYVRIVRRGRRKLVLVADLTKWLEENATTLLPRRTR
jgi:hypothetical protein